MIQRKTRYTNQSLIKDNCDKDIRHTFAGRGCDSLADR